MIRSKKNILLFIAAVLIFMVGFLTSKHDVFTKVKEKIKYSLQDSDPVEKEINKGNIPLDTLRISISKKGVRSLKTQEAAYLKAGLITASKKDYVKIKADFKGKTTKGKLRFKGDLTNHLNSDRQSFRVKLKKKFNGMTKFSITHPKARNYVHEYIYHKMFKYIDLMHLKYEFIYVSINDSTEGVYALEQHIDESTFEYNGKTSADGFIMKFDDYAFFKELNNQMWSPHRYKKHNGSYSFYSTDLVPFGEEKAIKNDSLKRHLQRATYLIEALKNKQVKTSDVFDVDKMGKYFAILDIVGGQHSSDINNMRLFYDFKTEKFEPIGFDGNGNCTDDNFKESFNDVILTDHLSSYYSNVALRTIDAPYFLSKTLFSDDALYEAYVKYLAMYSKEEFLNGFFEKYDEEFHHLEKVIQISDPGYRYNVANYYRNQVYINSVLNPAKEINAFLHENTGQQLTIDVGNVNQLPVHIFACEFKGQKVKVNKIVSPKIQFQPVIYDSLSIPLSKEGPSKNEEIILHYSILGLNNPKKETVKLWSKRKPDKK